MAEASKQQTEATRKFERATTSGEVLTKNEHDFLLSGSRNHGHELTCLIHESELVGFATGSLNFESLKATIELPTTKIGFKSAQLLLIDNMYGTFAR